MDHGTSTILKLFPFFNATQYAHLCFITHVQAWASVHYPHTHSLSTSAKVHSQEAVLSLYVQMSRLENNEKAPQGQRARISTVCVTLLEQKSKEVNSTKIRAGAAKRRTSWCQTWCQRRSSPGHGCPPCQSNGCWRREGWGWSACSAGGRRGKTGKKNLDKFTNMQN